MIITEKYAKKLVRQGKAKIEGHTTTAPHWSERASGRTYAIVTRYDLQRTDHYEEASHE